MSKSRKKDVNSDIKSDEIIENSGKKTDAGISENIDGTVEAKTEDIIEDAASDERSDAVKEEPAEDKKLLLIRLLMRQIKKPATRLTKKQAMKLTMMPAMK